MFAKQLLTPFRNAIGAVVRYRAVTPCRDYVLIILFYSLDPAQKDYLIEMIESLLNDNSTLVLGSVVSSMNQICPDRFDLIHKHYRKLCRLLVDADEWGQVTIMELLMRYARIHFLDPNAGNQDAAPGRKPSRQAGFYSDGESEAEVQMIEHTITALRQSNSLDSDHDLLLRSCTPLLNSRNSSVSLPNLTANMLGSLRPIAHHR